jgi:hypothetical protein
MGSARKRVTEQNQKKKKKTFSKKKEKGISCIHFITAASIANQYRDPDQTSSSACATVAVNYPRLVE